MTNVDAAEVGRFEALSHRFWDPHGEFRPLHILNPVRAQFVAERSALKGARVLDVGCGGGLLCESYARAGASVTGIDLAPGMIDVARLHATEQGLKIDYRVCDADTLEGGYDVVSCMEMLEHVPDPAKMTATLARLVRPGGGAFHLHHQSQSQIVPARDRRRRIRVAAHPARHARIRAAHPSGRARAAGRAPRGSTCARSPGSNSIRSREHCRLSQDPSVNYLMHLQRDESAS